MVVSGESFEPLMKELGSSIGKLLSPMMMIIEGMMSVGGGEMGMDKLQGMVDNLMGKVLLKMITNKRNTDVGESKTDQIFLFGELVGLAKHLEKDFHILGRKLELPEFWKGELFRFGMDSLHHTNMEEVVEEDVELITSIVEKYVSEWFINFKT